MRNGWWALVKAVVPDVLAIGILAGALFLVGVVVGRWAGLVAEYDSATFVLRDGTVVEAHSPAEVTELRERFRGRVSSCSFRYSPAGNGTIGLLLVAGALPLAFGGWTAFRDRRKLRAWFRPAPGDLPLAILGAAAFLLLSAGATWPLGRAAGPPFPGADPASPVTWLFLVGLAPLGEELWFRGRLQDLATGLVGPRAGILLPAALFGLVHAGQSGLPAPVVVGVTFGFGLVAGLLRARTGRLVAPWLAHALANTAVLLVAVLAS